MEHLNEKQCAAYRDQTLGVHDLLAVDEHIAGCEACRQRLQIYQVTGPVAPVMTSLGIKHLSYEEMEAYVEELTDAATRRLVESHSHECGSCLQELNDLTAFRRQLAVSGAEIGQHVTVLARKPSFRWRFSFLAAAATIIVLVSAAWWWRGRSSIGRQQPMLLAINDGGSQLRFAPTGRLITGEWTDWEREVIEDSFKNKSVGPPAGISELRGRHGIQRGDSVPAGFKLVYPAGLAVLTTRPKFVWQQMNGARQYVVEIFDLNFHRAATSPPLATTEWTPGRPLEAGRVYSWQVTASAGARTVIAPGASDPEARFAILGATAARELAIAASRHPGAHLLLGALYARAGVLDRAERELTALVEANPQSPQAHALLESVIALLQPQK